MKNNSRKISREEAEVGKYLDGNTIIGKCMLPDFYVPKPSKKIEELTGVNGPMFIDVRSGFGRISQSQRDVFGSLKEPVFVARVFKNGRIKLYRMVAGYEKIVAEVSVEKDEEILGKMHEKYPHLDNEMTVATKLLDT